MKIYFAGSIRAGREDVDLYAEIIVMLSKYGEVLTEHVGDNNISSCGENTISDVDIYNRDMDWLEDADILVAEVTNPSLGVGYEIGKAESFKSVLCVYREKDDKRISAMINGNHNLQVRKYSEIDELEEVFKTFFSSL